MQMSLVVSIPCCHVELVLTVKFFGVSFLQKMPLKDNEVDC